MTYREQLNKVRDLGISICDLKIADELDAVLDFEYTEEEFESLCAFSEDILNSDGSVAEEWEDTYECLEAREKEELFYEIYQNGYYCSDHYTVKVQKLEIIA